jgi:hypothetical protein
MDGVKFQLDGLHEGLEVVAQHGDFLTRLAHGVQVDVGFGEALCVKQVAIHADAETGECVEMKLELLLEPISGIHQLLGLLHGGDRKIRMDWLDRRELRVGLLTRVPRPVSASPSLNSSQLTHQGGGFLKSQKLRLQELQQRRQHLEFQKREKEQYLQYLKRTIAVQSRQSTAASTSKGPPSLGSAWDLIVQREQELENSLLQLNPGTYSQGHTNKHRTTKN